MKKAYPYFTVSELCQALGVASSGFYYKKARSFSDVSLHQRIRVIFSESNNTYGKRRIRKALLNDGVSVSLYKVSKLMKQMGLRVRYPGKKPAYPTSGEQKSYAPNLLEREFNPNTHNTHWVTDVTYIRSAQGWSYLACVMDLGTKEVVGYALSRSPDTQLTLAALNMAIINKKPVVSQLLVHSDQGSHYSSHVYRNHLSVLGIRQSMSRRGNCWDNSVMERFFRSLKSEHLNELIFLNHSVVIMEVERYIRFYNYKRLHSSLNYQTPHERYTQMKKAA